MEVVTEKSWFGRNWLWLVPVGGCLTVIVLFVLGVGAAIFGVSKALKNSEPVEFAMQRAQEHPEVLLLLGTPIETDGMWSGNLSFKNDSGEVNLSIPIKGSKSKGNIVVRGHKFDGVWSYEELYVLIKETQDEINLLNQDLEGI